MRIHADTIWHVKRRSSASSTIASMRGRGMFAVGRCGRNSARASLRSDAPRPALPSSGNSGLNDLFGIAAHEEVRKGQIATADVSTRGQPIEMRSQNKVRTHRHCGCRSCRRRCRRTARRRPRRGARCSGSRRIGRIQTVVATASVWLDFRKASRASAGVFQPSVLRGRALRAIATAAMSSSSWALRSVPFGKYWRSSPLVFSLVPRCQGLCGSQK